MPFDIQEYYNKHKDYYGDVPLDAVAKDIYDRGYSDKFGDFGEFKKAAGIHDTILVDSNRRKGPSSVSPLRLGKSFVKGAAEGLTTELPSMVGKSLQFVGPPGGKIEHAGKSIADWAEEKREAWYGPEEERSGLDRIVYEGAKMFAPSVIPGGIAGTAARGALRVGSIAAKAKTAADVAQKTALMAEATRKAGIAVNIGSGAAAGLFGLSQAQETRDTALERADQLEAEGKTKEAQEMRKKAYGVAPLATGAVEALGEFLGTKYLAKLFRLDESVIAKMGTKEFAINLLKTMGVEVGTEIGQEGSQAFIEKHTEIRPEANPLQEAMDVIGPTVFLTLLTGGLAGAANKMRSDDKGEREGAQELERLKQGAVLTMTIHDGLKTGQHQGRPFTADDASKLMKMGQAAGFYTKDDIERFHEQYPVLKPAANELFVEDVKKKVTEALFNEKGQPLLPPGQGFTFRDVDYGIPVGEPYGGEDILRPTITRAPEEAIDAEFETIRQLPAARRDEALALPPGQGFTLIETPPAKEVDYQAEAEKHGVKYNGIQKGHKDIPDMPMFTADIDGVQTTFVLNQGETLPQAIERKRLQKAEYDTRETKKEPIDVESGASPVTEVPVGQIKISKDVKQFKEGADEAGIVAGQEIKGEGYRRTPYNPIVLWRRNNGDLEVVTGRHRLEFAKRIGEETIPAQILNESDGFTAQDALTFDAEQNILDNQGTERDYANYFRNTEIDEATARERGLLRGKKAVSAFLLGKDATDQTFNAFFRHKDIGFRQAVAIARAAPGDERLQLAGRSYVAKNPRATEMEVENFVRAISLAKEAPKQVQGDLFGFDDSAIRTAEMQAKKASAVMGRLRRDLSNINAAIRGEGKLVLSDEGATEYGIKDQNSKEQLQTAKTKIQNEIGKWEKWYVNPELVKQLTEAPPAKPAKEIAKGKAAEPGAKEPWEMTFDEHDKLSSKRYDELHVNDFGVTDDRNIKRKSSPGVYYHVVEPNYSGGDIYSYDEAVKKGLLADEQSARMKNEWRREDFFKATDAKNVSLFKTISEAIDHQVSYGGKILEINVPREIGTNAEGYAVARIIPKEWITKEIGSHKEIVKQALVEGKPVPKEVLDDYPDLQGWDAEQAKAKAAKERTAIGQNEQGNKIYEDENGVRSIVESGVRISETVQVVPTEDGLKAGVDVSKRARRFKTTDELAGEKPVEQAKPGLSEKSTQELVGDIFSIINDHIGNRGSISNRKIVVEESLYQKIKPYLIEIARRAKERALDVKAYLFGAVDAMPNSTAKKVYESAAERYIEEETSEKDESPAAPYNQVADSVLGKLQTGIKFTRNDLFAMCDKAFNGTLAEGKYSAKDAYDALEMGVNKYIMESPSLISASPQNAKRIVADLKGVMELLPTQSTRTEEMDEWQQFSTPPPLAYAANWVSNLNKNDSYLEPSGGTGGLASFALIASNRPKAVVVNELAPRRAAILNELGFDRVFTENAEQLNNILPQDVKPTVVVMNPPFSATAGRVKGQRKTANATVHIEQALKRLQPGGRLVAIVGKGMAADRPAFEAWWNKIRENFDVLANVGISGQEYAKYGTTFDNQIVIIDKPLDPSTKESIIEVREDVNKVEELIDLLTGVRNARTDTSKQKSTEQGKQKGTAIPETEPGRSDTLQPPTGGVVAGAQPGRPGRKADADSGGDEGLGAGERDEVSGAKPRDEGTGRPGVVAAGQKQPTRAGRSDRVDDTRQAGGNAPAVPPEAVESLTVEQREAVERRSDELTDSVYDAYRPAKVKIPNAKEHPGRLVESAAMASVEPIDPTYSPKIPEKAVKSGKISIAQLEAVVYAGQAHSELLPDGSRKGFFIGDGTGVGKGREIAAIIWDNWNQGRRKAVWVSQNSPLMQDAKRDVAGVGWDSGLLFDIGKSKLQEPLKQKEGIGFVGYGTMRSKKVIDGKEVSRLDQLLKWLGKDFDGCIIFDESHNMGNALPAKGKRGTTKPSATALTGVDLQRLLPKARIVYVSATGATEVMNLAYAERLGLWGDKTPFPTATHFVSSISSGGITAMELVAMNMKANGVYAARSLAYDDVKYERLEHPLTGDQRQIYDELAGAWQIAQNDITAAMTVTGVTAVDASGGQVALNKDAKAHIMAQFWGTNQRFWNQVITAMQMPSVIKAIEKDLKEGRAPLIQLINTNEAAQQRAIGRMEEEDSLEDLDITPKDMLIEYVNNSFPVYQFETYTDDQGNERSRLVRDSNGDPVLNAEAVKMRDELLMKIAAIRVPDGPLEMLLDHFGVDQVAEVTGRTRRVVYKDTAEGRQRVVESWGKNKGMADADAFMADKKKILVFSQAGGTGRSYHADRTEKNTRLRRHYLVQAGWRADVAVQGLGRSHRTNQEQAPEWVLVTTNLEGQRRFISSIARRLSQLGALTKGSRETGNQGLFNARDNLESIEAVDAFHQLLEDLHEGSVSDITMSEFIESTGLDKIIDQDTGALNVSQLPAITQFLNRILNMKIEMQNKVFGEFLKRLNVKVAMAIEKGTLDVGVETIRAKRTEKVNEQDVYQDKKTNAKATYVEVELTHDAKLLTFNQSQTHNQFGYVQNIKSGRIWALAHRRDKTDAITGGISRQYTAIGANHNYHTITEEDVNNPEKYNKLSNREAEPLWNADHEAAPKEIKERVHMITGAVLPIWDRLPTGTAKIYRLQVDGKNIIGRVIGKKNLDETLRKLGAQRKAGQYKTDDVFDNVLSRGYKYGLSNGWNIQRRKVADDFRIEIKGPNYYNLEELRKYGVFTERIGYETRFFIPTEKGAGVRAINEIISSRPIVDEVAAGKKAGDVTAQDAAFMNETEQYAIGTRTEAGDISLVDVQATFRGQKVTQTKEGFLISTSAGNVLVKSVDRIDANTYALNVGYGKERLTEGDVVAGRYRGGVITLKRGTANRFTLAHESIHFMEDIGVIGAGETKLLKNHIKNLVEAGKFETLNPEDIGGAEDRAEFLAGKLTQEPKGLLGRIIRNIQDFIDRIVNAFGIRTIKGIVRDIKTGKVFGSKVDTRAELAYNYVHEEVSDRERETLRGDTRGQAGVQYQPTVVGREKIGVAKAASRTIRKPRDAAQIASQYLKRYPDEHLISMVMDKSGKLLHIYRHTVGLPGYTQVSVAIVAGEALNTPGAANIIVAHNHPSQRAELSAEDRAFTKSLEDTLRGSGVKLTDSLAVTSDSYSSHKETGGDLQTGLSGAAAGKVNIPILGRVFEVIHNGPKISNSESAKAQAETFIPGGGILVMDGQNAIAGTVDISDFNKIRGNVQAELLKAFEQRNGRNMIVYAPNRAIKPKEADNLSRFLRAARNEVKLLDIIDTTGSWADQGNLPLANVGDVDFYSYRAKADTFYSKLIKTVTGKIKEMPSKIQSIPKWLGRQNVKPAEMKWMGVEQWLKDNSKNGVIGKQAFADFLKSNQIEIREVTKGGNVGNILKRSQIRPHIENGETVFGYNDTTEEWDSVSNVKEANQYAEFSLTRPESGTKFHAYTIPGGENYRELLLMLPPPKRTIPSYEEWVGLEKMKQEDASVWDFAGDVKAEIDFSRARYEREKVPLHSEEAYRSDHWDEPNVLAHVRMNDRVDADGNRVLFLEEVQSDWHQEGKKKGYKQEVPDELQKRFDEAQKKRQQEQNKFYDLREVVGPNGPINEQRQIMAAAEREFEAINQERSKYTGGVPPAPFAENWHELLMKRMLRYAAENGYDKIAWTTGEIQAERYDLSKYIDRIEYEPAFVKGGSGKEMPSLYEFVAYGKDGKEIIHEDEIDLKRIEEIAGKEIAEKIRDDVGESMSKERPYRDWRKLSGLDLKVGGEGMKSFYDNLIPGFMNKYVKQWGAKVGLIDITAEGVNEYGESIDESVMPSREVSAHSVDITPAMKQDVLFKGQEYYSIRDSKAPPTTRDPKVVNEYIKDEADAIFQTIMNKLKPKSMTWLETMLKSPEWFDHPQINNIVRLFVRDRNEIYHQTFNDLNMADDIDATESTITEAGKALKGKGLSLVDRLAGKESAEYKMLSDFLDYFDTEAKRDPNKSDAENLADCEAYMRKNGATDDVVRVWRLYRQSYDKALDLQTRQLREMIDKVVEEATFRGESPEASLAELKSTLKYALAEMEKWRGYYAPRIREAGDWKVQAYKEHGPLEANREYYREHRASELSAQRLAKKLARDGWKITSIGRVEKLPESVYQDVKAVAAAKLIDKALERVEAHDTSLVGLNAEILRAVADEIKARGFRSHMIHRKGGAAIKGYIEDPLTRHLLYINQLSGGISKSVVAQRAMKELLGEKIMGKQVGGIDPVADPRAYAVATNYIQEQLRNMDATDRVIGLAKSVATFKFLGFNLRSLTVNMTALLTTTPTSIHQYATGGKGNMTTILKSLVSAGKDFGSFMAGRKLASAEEQAFLEEIHKKGWDDAQYTRDALGTIQRTHSRAWSDAMSASMYLFGVSEKFNRGTTLLSAYRMARKQGHSAEEAAEMAKTASDNAHGTYGRATLPMWAQGPNPAAKIGQMLYVYAKFPHNYLQMLYDVGFKKHNVKGALFAFLSPIVLAGVAALPFKDVIFAFAGFLLRAIGDDERDPEKWVWDNVRKHLGEGAERAGRHGITGALGVDLSGSLSIGVGVPKGLMDLTGAIGGVIEDVGAFGQGIATKQYSKAAESILPTGLGNPLRAYRESKEGVSTRDNRPVWDESGRQFVPTGGEAATKALGFRSTRQAVLSERTWEARRQRASFNEKRSQIYRKYRAWILSGRDKERYREIVKEVQKYNRDLHRLGLEREIAPITSQSLKSQSGRMQAPSKRDRAMLENRY